MSYSEVRNLESVSFNVREKIVYILIKNEVYKSDGGIKSLISSTNERLSLPVGVSLEVLNDIEGSNEICDLIRYYWSTFSNHQLK